MNKHFLNEEGITLTELLAALSLFAVVSALVMTVLFNVFQNSENISDNAQLRQDANLLVSTLRSHYNQGDFEVGLNTSNSLLIGGQEVNSSMTSSIAELKINGENLISDGVETKSMDITADGTPLPIDLTLKNEAGQTYNLFTTIEKPAELAIELQPVPPVLPDGDWVDGYTCEDIVGNTRYAYDPDPQFIPDYCEPPVYTDPIKITGNAWVSRDYHHNVVEMKHDGVGYTVTGNFFVDTNEFNVDNKHFMDVGGDALIKYGKLELKNKTEFIATNIHAPNGNHNDRGIVVRDRTRLKARESIVVGKTFYIVGQTFVDEHNTIIPSKDLWNEGKGHVIIGKNLIANTVEAFNDSIININGSASISSDLLADHRSLIKIGKNLIIEGDLKMPDNAEIIVEGNARINNLILGVNSKLTIKGNLTVTGDVENNGTLDVTGIKNF